MRVVACSGLPVGIPNEAGRPNGPPGDCGRWLLFTCALSAPFPSCAGPIALDGLFGPVEEMTIGRVLVAGPNVTLTDIGSVCVYARHRGRLTYTAAQLYKPRWWRGVTRRDRP
jgi:hypothetical protein